MSQESKELPPAGGTIQERVQELTWALIDEQITADETRLLENLLLSDDHAARTYVECVQMHSDLVHHFATADKSKVCAKSSPVLGFLGVDLPPFSAQPPTPEDSRS